MPPINRTDSPYPLRTVDGLVDIEAETLVVNGTAIFKGPVEGIETGGGPIEPQPFFNATDTSLQYRTSGQYMDFQTQATDAKFNFKNSLNTNDNSELLAGKVTLAGSAAGKLISSQTNRSVETSSTAGFKAASAASEIIMEVGHSTNTTIGNRGVIRTAATAGLDMVCEGPSKSIKLTTNSVARVTVGDSIVVVTEPINITDATESTSTTSGSITTSGGIGAERSIIAGGVIKSNSTLPTSIQTAGGITGASVIVTGRMSTSSTASDSIQTLGGMAAAGGITGGTLSVASTENNSIVTNGGVTAANLFSGKLALNSSDPDSIKSSGGAVVDGDISASNIQGTTLKATATVANAIETNGGITANGKLLVNNTALDSIHTNGGITANGPIVGSSLSMNGNLAIESLTASSTSPTSINTAGGIVASQVSAGKLNATSSDNDAIVTAGGIVANKLRANSTAVDAIVTNGGIQAQEEIRTTKTITGLNYNIAYGESIRTTDLLTNRKILSGGWNDAYGSDMVHLFTPGSTASSSPDPVFLANKFITRFPQDLESTAYDNGAATFAGGVGIGKNLNVNGNISCNSISVSGYQTFTPYFVSGVAVTYLVQSGIIYKVGSLTFLSCKLVTSSAIDTVDTNLSILGIPDFYPLAVPEEVHGTVMFENFALGTSVDHVTAAIEPSQPSRIVFKTTRDGLPVTYVKTPTTTQTRVCVVTITYLST